MNTYVNKHKFAPLHHKYHVKKAYWLMKAESHAFIKLVVK